MMAGPRPRTSRMLFRRSWIPFEDGCEERPHEGLEDRRQRAQEGQGQPLLQRIQLGPMDGHGHVVELVALLPGRVARVTGGEERPDGLAGVVGRRRRDGLVRRAEQWITRRLEGAEGHRHALAREVRQGDARGIGTLGDRVRPLRQVAGAHVGRVLAALGVAAQEERRALGDVAVAGDDLDREGHDRGDLLGEAGGDRGDPPDERQDRGEERVDEALDQPRRDVDEPRQGRAEDRPDDARRHGVDEGRLEVLDDRVDPAAGARAEEGEVDRRGRDDRATGREGQQVHGRRRARRGGRHAAPIGGEVGGEEEEDHRREADRGRILQVLAGQERPGEGAAGCACAGGVGGQQLGQGRRAGRCVRWQRRDAVELGPGPAGATPRLRRPGRGPGSRAARPGWRWR